MARKKAPEKAANHERWLVSYADFITLLFAVFVTLYAMSQVDKKKLEEVAHSYRSAFGITATGNAHKPEILFQSEIAPIPVPAPQPPKERSQVIEPSKGKKLARHQEFRQMVAGLEKYFLERKVSNQVDMEINTRGLEISLKESGIFDSGSATIKPGALSLLAEIAIVIKPYGNQLSFEGHTDNEPMHSLLFPSNWELSAARATSIARYFIDQNGIDPKLVSVTGYGEFRPKASNDTEEGRRQNRRVDVVILSSQPDARDEDSPLEAKPIEKKLPF